MSVIWGIPYLLIKVAVDEVSPVVVVFARCVVGAALLLPWTIAQGSAAAGAAALAGAAAVHRRWRWPGPGCCSSYAEQSLSSSLTGLLVAAVPVRRGAGRAGWPARRSGSPRCGSLGMGIGRRRHRGAARARRRAARSCCRSLAVGAGASSATPPAPLVVSRALPDVPGVAASSIALFVTAVVYAPFAVPQLGRAGRRVRRRRCCPWSRSACVCTALALALFFALIREVGPAAGAGHHLRQPRGRGAARRPAARRAVHPRHRRSACRWCWSAACWPPGAARSAPSRPSSATSTPASPDGTVGSRRLASRRDRGAGAVRLGEQRPRVRRLPRRGVGDAAARATTPCSSGSASRRSSPGCPGSRSCASGRRSGRRSPASRSTRSPRSPPTTRRG